MEAVETISRLALGLALIGFIAWFGKFFEIQFPRQRDYAFEFSFNDILSATDGPALELKRRADDGDVEAQFQFGALLASLAESDAADYLLKAAEAGHPAAQNEIAYAFEQGAWGLEKDVAAAISWYDKAAAAGDMTAQYNLATFYRDGDFVEQNDGRAASLFLQSAQQGYAGAQFNFYLSAREGVGASWNGLFAMRARLAAGDLYDDAKFISDNFQLPDRTKLGGLGSVKSNYAAQSSSDPRALRCIALHADLSPITESRRVPSEIVVTPGDGTDTAEEILEIIQSGGTVAGPPVEPAISRAALLALAAKMGDPVAQNRLADAYAAGEGVARSNVKADYWRQRSERNPLKVLFPEQCP